MRSFVAFANATLSFGTSMLTFQSLEESAIEERKDWKAWDSEGVSRDMRKQSKDEFRI